MKDLYRYIIKIGQGKTDSNHNYIESDDFDKVYQYINTIADQEAIDNFNKNLLPLLVTYMTNNSLTTLLDNPKVTVNHLYSFGKIIEVGDDIYMELIKIIAQSPLKFKTLLKNGLNINKNFPAIRISIYHRERKSMSLIEYIKFLIDRDDNSDFAIGINLLNVLVELGYNKYEILNDEEITKIKEKYDYYVHIVHSIENITMISNIKPTNI